MDQSYDYETNNPVMDADDVDQQLFEHAEHFDFSAELAKYGLTTDMMPC